MNLTAGQTETKCQYCQNPVTLQQAEAQFSEVKSSKIGGTLLIAQTAQEGGSYEEALNYYNKVIEQEPTFADAWLNKGICMVGTSRIGDLKIAEAISSWKAAIKFAKNSDAMKKRVALEINSVVMTCFPVVMEHYHKFDEVDGSFEEYTGRFELLESALALALEFDPQSQTTAKTGIFLCDKFAESVRHSAYGGIRHTQIAKTVKKYRNRYLGASVSNPQTAGVYPARLRELGITSEVAELIFKGTEVADIFFKGVKTDAMMAFAEAYRPGLTEEEFDEQITEIGDAFGRAEAALKAEYPERFSPKKTGCFVATACYGNYGHPAVMELRHFRDDCLETSRMGRAFVRWYYQWSPAFASLVANNGVLKVLARFLIVGPALAVARLVHKRP